MKKIKLSLAIISIAAFSSIASAAKPGSYLGAGLGLSQLRASDNIIGVTTSKQVRGLGERGFVGYNFNEYLGLEAGLSHYAPSIFKNNLVKETHSLNALDVVTKAYLPLADSGLNIYGLAGIAYARSVVEVKALNNTHSITNKVRPKYGVGVSYDIPQSNWGTNVEWSRIQGVGNMKTNAAKAIPNADMLSLNIAYKFD